MKYFSEFIKFVLEIISVGIGFIVVILGIIALAVVQVMFYTLIITVLLMFGFKILGIYAIGTFVVGFWNVFKVTGLVLLIGKAISSGLRVLFYKQ